MSSYKSLILPVVGLLVVGGYWIWRSTAPLPDAASPPTPAKATGGLPSGSKATSPDGARGTASPSVPDSSGRAVKAATAEATKTRRDRAATTAMREQLREVARSGGRSRGGGQAADSTDQAKLDADYIQARVREDLIPIAEECYETALQTQPKLAGKLVMKFAIVGDPSVGGVVEEAMEDPTSDIRDPDLLECMRESMMSLSFPPPEGAGRVDVTYPFEFAPDEPGG